MYILDEHNECYKYDVINVKCLDDNIDYPVHY